MLSKQAFHIGLPFSRLRSPPRPLMMVGGTSRTAWTPLTRVASPSATGGSLYQSRFLGILNHKSRIIMRSATEDLRTSLPLSMERVKLLARDIPDFPTPGIMFKDFGPVFADYEACAQLRSALYAQVKHLPITKVLILETRGYLFGTLLAQDLKTGVVPVRKAGKLPGDTLQITYDLEYKKGEKCEIQAGLLGPSDIILIHDDLIATGGTVQAAIDLALKAGVKAENIYVSFIGKITFLKGVEKIRNFKQVFSLMDLD
ncbi:Adenine phosphoribosyltransferase [Spironucleus salmonicida]|nr:Adenine phosphoribosyltransferase [Spironucleus salmonicida]|eukprot:EST49104.1 Adenine phosphoribosyltransferase [Spironucleus salmonicida]